MLLWLILIPLIGAGLVPVVAKPYVRTVAYAATAGPLALALYILGSYSFAAGAPEALTRVARWAPDLGLTLRLSMDGVSAALVALTAFLGPLCVLGSKTAVTERVRTFYGWFLVLQAAMTGVFLARDVVLFYVFFEFTLVPMFILIALFGSANRRAASVKFFLYTFTGSVLSLAGLLSLAWYHAAVLPPGSTPNAGTWSLALSDLALAGRAMPANLQGWVFLALMAGFAVKVPLFPLHTWLPLAHTEAPTVGSVVLAGVLLKLGTYAIYTLVIPLVPDAAVAFAPAVGVLSVLGILAAGLMCWVQTDVKRLVAYSSVAHLGFCMLGMFAFNRSGLQGSLLYMINHGLSTPALFFCIGMIYERYHTRSMDELGGLGSRMPAWSSFMVFFTMASVGLPGLNGFVGEFLTVKGAFEAGALPGHDGPRGGMTGGVLGPWFAAWAVAGMIVAAVYLLYMLGRVVWGTYHAPGEHGGPHAAPHSASHGQAHGHGPDEPAGGAHTGLPTDLSGREVRVLVPLAALCLLLGVYPAPLLNMFADSVDTTASLMQGALRRAEQVRPEAPEAGSAAQPQSAGAGDGAAGSGAEVDAGEGEGVEGRR
ncbi:MAG: hypothetical protein C0475_03070 [Planctomyces sp.]|nr:hypothetical protein [Planctomyces sp.]